MKLLSIPSWLFPFYAVLHCIFLSSAVLSAEPTAYHGSPLGLAFPFNSLDPTQKALSIYNPTFTHLRIQTQASAGQVQDKLHTGNPNILKLVQIVGERELSVKEMMNGVELRGRDNFLNLYLNPAIVDGDIRLLYPKSPRHPRQRYLLTLKGQLLYQELNQNK